MGEIADMMIDGTLCEGCGVYMGDECGYPRMCRSCQEWPAQEAKRAEGQKKVPCPQCGRHVKAVGLTDHVRDAHKSEGSL